MSYYSSQLTQKPYYGNKDIYYITERIGSGGQAQIFRARDRKGKEYALKLYHEPSKPKDEEANKQMFFKERYFHRLLNNNHFAVKMVDYSIEQMFIVLELLRNTEFMYDKYESIQPKIIQLMCFYDMLCDLHYVHKQGVAHNDIKPMNFLYDDDQNIFKIADFGLACSKSCEAVGTFYWIAPEILEYWDTFQTIKFMQKADIWSLGVCIYYILSYKNFPFTYYFINKKWEKLDLDLNFKLVNKFEIKPKDIEIKLSAENQYMQPLLERFFQIDPEKRITLPEAITFVHSLLMQEAKKLGIEAEYEKDKKYNLKHILSMGESGAKMSKKTTGSPKRMVRSKSPTRSSPKRVTKAKTNQAGSFRRSRNNE